MIKIACEFQVTTTNDIYIGVDEKSHGKNEKSIFRCDDDKKKERKLAHAKNFVCLNESTSTLYDEVKEDVI